MNPVETTYSSGSTLYAVIHHTDGRVWNDITELWEAFDDSKWVQYSIPLTEQGASGYYRAAYPAGAAGVLTTEVVYNQAGGSPGTVDAPATGVGQSQGVDVAAIKTNVVSASNLEQSLSSMIQGAVTAIGTSTASKIYTDLSDAAANVYQGRIIIFTSGVLIRQVANILSYDETDNFLTVAGPFTAAPALADTFIIV